MALSRLLGAPQQVVDGGTGARTANGAVANLTGGFPIPVSAGGTGGSTQATAHTGLFSGLPLEIQYGGTGQTTLAGLFNNLSVSGWRNRIVNGCFSVFDNFLGTNGLSISAGVNLSSASQTSSANRFTRMWFASATGGGVFTARAQQTLSPPLITDTLFSSYARFAVTSADSSIAAGDSYFFGQRLEGQFVFSETRYGTASAMPLLLSFWVRSSVNGVYGVSLLNEDATRSLTQSFTISAANTWELKTIQIPGDTSGTWANIYNNLRAAQLIITLSSGATGQTSTLGSWQNGSFIAPNTISNIYIGTAGATFDITGIQLELDIGNLHQPTPFDFRGQFPSPQIYSYQTVSSTPVWATAPTLEALLCERYKSYGDYGESLVGVITGNSRYNVQLKVVGQFGFRASPTFFPAYSGGFILWRQTTVSSGSPTIPSGGTSFASSVEGLYYLVDYSAAGGGSTGNVGVIVFNNLLACDAEL